MPGVEEEVGGSRPACVACFSDWRHCCCGPHSPATALVRDSIRTREGLLLVSSHHTSWVTSRTSQVADGGVAEEGAAGGEQPHEADHHEDDVGDPPCLRLRSFFGLHACVCV